MKKILLLSLLFLTILTGCQKDNDPAPGERPEERLSKALAEYKALLVSAEHGWKAVLFTGSGGGYSFHFRFGQNDRVVMAGDVNAASATPMESTYRLKVMQRPTLIFDTYSYLHTLTDPDPNVSGGEAGVALGSDFEFWFESVTPETVTLRGNFRNSRLILTRATSEEAANFVTGVAASAQVFGNMDQLKTYFKRLTVGNQTYDISVNTRFRTITFTYGESNTLRHFTTNFYYTPDGIVLLEPLTANNTTITGLTSLSYNAGTNTLNFRINDVAGTIQESNSPAIADVQGARNLLNSPTGDQYWLTDGFETADIRDLYNVYSYPDMAVIAFWPNFYENNFDLLGFVLEDPVTNEISLDHGPTATSRVTNDGRIIFNYTGNLEERFPQIPPPPEALVPIITATREQWVDPQGYYYVEEGEGVAVLVSAQDAKIWMRLFR